MNILVDKDSSNHHNANDNPIYQELVALTQKESNNFGNSLVSDQSILVCNLFPATNHLDIVGALARNGASFFSAFSNKLNFNYDGVPSKSLTLAGILNRTEKQNFVMLDETHPFEFVGYTTKGLQPKRPSVAVGFSQRMLNLYVESTKNTKIIIPLPDVSSPTKTLGRTKWYDDQQSFYGDLLHADNSRRFDDLQLAINACAVLQNEYIDRPNLFFLPAGDSRQTHFKTQLIMSGNYNLEITTAKSMLKKIADEAAEIRGIIEVVNRIK